MRIQKIIDVIEEWAPPVYAENFDNVGLIIGDAHRDCKGVLVTHDTLENVVDECISKNLNLIVSFHPIIFLGLKKLTQSSYVERVIIKADCKTGKITYDGVVLKTWQALQTAIFFLICEIRSQTTRG